MSLPEGWPRIEVKRFSEVEQVELCASCGSQNSRPCHKCHAVTHYCFSCNHNIRNHKCRSEHPAEKKLHELQSVFNEVAGLASAAENLMKGDNVDRIVQEQLDHDRRIHEQEKEQLRRLLDKMNHDFVLSAKAHEKRIAELIAEHESTVELYKSSVKTLEEEVKKLKFNTLERVDVEKKLTALRGLPRMKRGSMPIKSTSISEIDVNELQMKLTTEESQIQSLPESSSINQE
jgi:hypothetical protein